MMMGRTLYMRLFMLMLFCSLLPALVAQNVSINADGAAPDSSAMLDVADTTRGFLPPRMTTTQMNNISGPANGLFIYNTDSLAYMYYDGSAWVEIGTGSSNSGSAVDSAAESGVVVLKDVKNNAIDGGTFTAGSWQTRDLNTKSGDTSFITLSSNEFTLTDGAYLIEATAPAFRVGHHRIRIYNVSDAATEITGPNNFSNNNSNEGQTNATLQGLIDVSGNQTFRLEHHAQVTQSSNGYGPSHAVSGESESYSEITIIKLDKVFGSGGSSSSSSSTTVNSTNESGIALVYDEKSAGSQGGTSAAGGWQSRDLNTYTGDSSFISLSSNEFTLSSGVYLVSWSAPGYEVDEHRSRLYNVTDLATEKYGSVEFTFNGSEVQNHSVGEALVDISTSTSFRIEHYTEATSPGDGLGYGNLSSIGPNIFTQIKVIKLDKVFGSGSSSSTSSSTDTLDENHFSARISSVGGITSENRSFITSVNNSATGTYDITFVAGFFSVAPKVSGSVEEGLVSVPRILTVRNVSTTGCTVYIHNEVDGANEVNSDFGIDVSRQGSDYKYNTAGGSASSNSSSDTLPLIRDADGNTLITTEQSANEDTIRFYAHGAEVMTIDSSAVTFKNQIVLPESLADSSGVIFKNGVRFLHTYNDPAAAFSGRNLYIGEDAGNFTQTSAAELNTGVGWQALNRLTSGGANAAFGYRSLDAVESGRQNTAIGYNSMRNDTVGSFNTAVGAASLRFNDGDLNTAIGHNSMRLAFGTAQGNTAVGAQTLYQIQGNHNVAIGDSAGYNSVGGIRNVFIGSKAGLNETGDYKLYIESDSINNPLIWGDFLNDSIKIYGTLSIGDSTTFPTTRGTNGQVLTSNGAGQIVWQNAVAGSANQLQDGDGNTLVQVEETANDDIIRFDMNGTEFFRMDSGRFQVVNTGNSIFLGEGAGANDNYADNRNIFIGTNAGNTNTNGVWNVFSGYAAGRSNTSGQRNIFMGYEAGLDNTTGSGNVMIGTQSGFEHQAGTDNVFLGTNTGRNNISGDSNVFVGNNAGANETGSHLLYIENTSSTSPLIWGNFMTDSLVINGRLNIAGNYAFPDNVPSSGQVLRYNGSDLEWGSTTTKVLADDDGNTQIQVEESTNDDIIRFDMNGTEYFRMNTGRLEVANTGNSVIMGDSAGTSDNLGGNNNTFIGNRAGKSVAGTENVYVGNQAGENATADFNVGIGNQALRDIGSGDQNVAIGDWSMQQSGGVQNVSVGAEALLWNNGPGNVAVGYGALGNTGGSAYTGQYNVAIGNLAGQDVDGDNNVFIGKFAGQSLGSVSNQLYINNDGGSPLIYGDFSADSLVFNADAHITGNLGIGTYSPTAKLSVVDNTSVAVRLTSHASTLSESPNFLLYRTRGTESAPAAVVNNDNIGRLTAAVYDGASYSNAAKIQFEIDNTPGVGDTPGRIQFHTTPDGSGTTVERMRITSEGYVGIGSTNPLGELMVQSTTDSAEIYLIGNTNADQEHIYFGYNNGANLTGQIGMSGNLDLIASNTRAINFYTRGSQPSAGLDTATAVELAMSIAGDGNVGVGTFSPTYKLDVDGTFSANSVNVNDNYTLPTTSGTADQVLKYNSGGTALEWGTLSSSSIYSADGTLGGDRTVTFGTNDMSFNLNSVGQFAIQDAGTNVFQVSGTGITSLGGDMFWRDGNSASGTVLAALTDDGDDGYFSVYEDGNPSIILDGNSGVIFNEQSLDRDFRVESNLQTSMLHVDASANAVGIGTSLPSQELDVEGDIQIDGDYGYESARTEYISVSAAGFTPLQGVSGNTSIQNIEIGGFDTGNARWLAGGTANDPGYLFAPVNLPDGAIVTEVTFYVYDLDITAEIEGRLYRQQLGSSVVNIMATTGTTGVAAAVGTTSITDNTISNATISNSSYSYYLRVELEENNSNLRVYGARLTYTVTRVD